MQYRGFYVVFNDDCDENEGGYYCEVFDSVDMVDVLDTFCIFKEFTDCDSFEDTEHVAKSFVDDNYNALVEQKRNLIDFLNSPRQKEAKT